MNQLNTVEVINKHCAATHKKGGEMVAVKKNLCRWRWVTHSSRRNI